MLKDKISADKFFLFLLVLITFFGVLMIYNATVVFAQKNFGESSRFVLLHLGWLFIGFTFFLFFYKLDYSKLFYASFPIYLLTLLPLVLLAFISSLRSLGVISCENISFAPCINGVTRWFVLNPPPLPQIPIIGSLGFQVSEMAKFSIILMLSAVLSDKSKTTNNPYFLFLLYTGLFSGLILAQPNLSTASLVFAIGSFIYLVSKKPLKPFLIAVPVFLLLGVFFMFSSDYRRERVLTYLGSNKNESSNYHLDQVNIALGSGGLFGKGLGQSRQKFQFLPEVTSDSIFAIVGEELGWVGTVALILIFTLFIHRGYAIGKNAPDDFGKLLCTGVISWIGLQYVFNVGAMSGVFPLTGIPLPLVSYGGSSTVFVLAGLGIVANISKSKC